MMIDMKQIPLFLISPIVLAAGLAVPAALAGDSPGAAAAACVQPPQESAEALYRKALELEEDEPEDVDYATVAGLYRRAAEQGYAPAQLVFARCCYMGLGEEKDAAKGREWCLRAAETDAGVRSRYDMTALHVAAVAGDAVACKLLLERGADVNAKGEDG